MKSRASDWATARRGLSKEIKHLCALDIADKIVAGDWPLHRPFVDFLMRIMELALAGDWPLHRPLPVGRPYLASAWPVGGI